jgi:hypothetical protein
MKLWILTAVLALGNLAFAEALPPKDAHYTLLCKAYTSPAHRQESRQAKDYWTNKTGLQDFYVVHGDNESTLYFGYYRSYNDPRDKEESRRAQADRAKLDALTDTTGLKPFPVCIFMELVAPDPQANPEWNLANARGYWSLQIAAYKDSPQRKQAAVDSVIEARKQGIEAYYFHGPSTSSVCIGCWPREAVKEQESDAASTIGPQDAVLVTPRPIPGVGPGLLTKDGARVKTMMPKIEPIDPTMIKAMQTYPYHQLNGMEMVHKEKDRNGTPVDVRAESFLVLVPQNDNRGQGQGAPVAVNVQPLDQTQPAPDHTQPNSPSIAAPQPAKPRGGKLRSIGD